LTFVGKGEECTSGVGARDVVARKRRGGRHAFGRTILAERRGGGRRPEEKASFEKPERAVALKKNLMLQKKPVRAGDRALREKKDSVRTHSRKCGEGREIGCPARGGAHFLPQGKPCPRKKWAGIGG